MATCCCCLASEGLGQLHRLPVRQEPDQVHRSLHCQTTARQRQFHRYDRHAHTHTHTHTHSHALTHSRKLSARLDRDCRSHTHWNAQTYTCTFIHLTHSHMFSRILT